MDMRFGTWNVRSLFRTRALGLVTSEIDKCRMDLVGIQEVRWDGSGTLESGNCTLFYEEGNANHQVGTGFFCS
jgi:Endonuclease/Exonuclease/phosphatase family.